LVKEKTLKKTFITTTNSDCPSLQHYATLEAMPKKLKKFRGLLYQQDVTQPTQLIFVIHTRFLLDVGITEKSK